MTIQFLILKNLPRMEKTRMTEIHSQDTLHFIRTHRREDVRLLALQAHRYPSVDIPAAITQISGWQIAREKIPAWAENEKILYPVHLSLEQCSSEVTARYKAEIINRLLKPEQQSSEENATPISGNSFTDLTGGFGIDCGQSEILPFRIAVNILSIAPGFSRLI